MNRGPINPASAHSVAKTAFRELLANHGAQSLAKRNDQDRIERPENGGGGV
jgi:hypothetical protein